MRYALMLAFFAAFPALGDVLVARGSTGNELRLYEAPCRHAATLERIKDEWRDQFKMAQADMGGKVIDGCWIAVAEDEIYFVLIEGSDGFALSVQAFTLERGV